VAVGDFNGDGKPDLAVTGENSSDVSILLGNGDGTFQAPVSYAAGTTPLFVAVGDFNGDGKPDLVVANLESNQVSILLGDGGGTFQSPASYAVEGQPVSIAIGDFNGGEGWVFPQQQDGKRPMWDSGIRKALKLAAAEEGCDFAGQTR
jgi:VCBS repeat protein